MALTAPKRLLEALGVASLEDLQELVELGRVARGTASDEVDLDLDVMAPTPRSFRSHGTRYLLPPTVPIPVLIEAVRLKAQLNTAHVGDEMAELLEQMYELVLKCVQLQQPDVTEILLDEVQLFRVFTLMIGGKGKSLEEAVVSGLDVTGDDGPPELEPGEEPDPTTP